MPQNPQAFARPVSLSTYWDHPKEIPGQEGMSLRDYFAAAALTGLAASGNTLSSKLAMWAYRLADEMLEQREV